MSLFYFFLTLLWQASVLCVPFMWNNIIILLLLLSSVFFFNLHFKLFQMNFRSLVLSNFLLEKNANVQINWNIFPVLSLILVITIINLEPISQQVAPPWSHLLVFFLRASPWSHLLVFFLCSQQQRHIFHFFFVPVQIEVQVLCEFGTRHH